MYCLVPLAELEAVMNKIGESHTSFSTPSKFLF